VLLKRLDSVAAFVAWIGIQHNGFRQSVADICKLLYFRNRQLADIGMTKGKTEVSESNMETAAARGAALLLEVCT